MIDGDYTRLPSYIVPSHYNLRLEPDFSTFTFEGTVDILVEVRKETDTIAINANQLKVSKLNVVKNSCVESICSDSNPACETKVVNINSDAKSRRSKRNVEMDDDDSINQSKRLKSDQNESPKKGKDIANEDDWSIIDTIYEQVPVNNYEILVDKEIILIKLSSSLGPCSVRISVTYTGQLDDSMRGFYRTSHTLADGSKKWGAACHFEATGARKCFPCFDQPEFRSTYNITVVRPDTCMQVLSNMSVLSEEKFGVVKFMKTPPLPCYLVCVVIGYYSHIGQRSEGGIPVTVYTPQTETRQGEYALKVALRAVDYFGKFFGATYNLPKLDLVAVPDFYIGAMENWGLLTFRETALLFHPDLGTEKSKQYVSILVAHEIAHQWFGNLVSIEWWDQLWLKEGFATWISFLAVDKLIPEFDIWSQFLVMERLVALDLDCMANSHPIEIPDGVKNPGQIDEIFDDISYSKGASIINMLFHWLGEDKFKSGLQLYLSKYSGKSATTDMLWDAIEEDTILPVKRVMSDWTKVQGFPMVSVELVEEGLIRLKQECVSSNEDNFWIIPLRLELETGVVMDILFEETEMELEVEGVGGPKSPWLLINKGQTSFCRVNYSSKMLSLLYRGLDRLDIRDRAGLLADLAHGVWTGVLGVDNVLECVDHYQGEVEWSVVQVMMGVLTRLGELFEDTTSWGSFLQLTYRILGPSLDKLGWKSQRGEAGDVKLSRSAVIQKLGQLGHSETVGCAWVLWRDEQKTDREESVDKDIRLAVYSTVARTGKGEVVDILISKYKESSSGEEKRLVGAALSSCGVEEQRQRVLNWAISDEVKLQDRTFIISGVAACGPEGRESAWQFFVNNTDKLLRQYSSGQLLKNLVLGVTRRGNSVEDADRFLSWFHDQEVSGIERTLQQAAEEVRARANGRDKAVLSASQLFNLKSQ